MRKKSFLTLTDQFCGAGGSSLGAMMANIPGLEVKLALNHWVRAIETHQTNFPDAIHECTDISAADPRRYPSTDILITSPECTNHSLAKGKKAITAQLGLYEKGILDAAAERSRATMWDVPRFAEYHQYNIIIVENVVDARKWVMYDAWLMAMHALGYKHRAVYLNSMHAHPTPQSRDRMYVVFWKSGNKAPNLDFTPTAHCPKCQTDVESVQTWKRPDIRFGKYKQQYIYSCPSCATHVDPYYYAAFNCINWADKGTRIGDRKKELSANTIKRIEYGLKKYGNEVFTVTTRYTSGIDCRVKSIADTIGTQPGDISHGIAMPFVLLGEHSKVTPQTRKLTDVLQTQATRQSMGLLVPYIIEMNRTGEAKPATNHASTITSGGINHAVAIAPFIVDGNYTATESRASSVTNPMHNLTTQHRTGLLTTEAWNSFLSYNYNGVQTSHITEATYAVTTKDRMSLINYRHPSIDDCYYRMLKSAEVGKAMAFIETYVVCGTERDKVKQYGNAVTPPAMRELIKRCVASLQ